jgi:aminodeoxyfutalosine deaminase
MTDTWTLTARWIFPVDQPPLENGSITIRGDRIAAVQAHGTVVADVDLGNVAVLPGLVNAHTHLDLSGMRGVTEPSPDLVGWLRQVIAYRRTRTSVDVENDVRLGLAEAVGFGTTLLGDISGDGGSWEVLAKAPLRAVVFREILGLSADRAAGAWELSDRWIRSREATANCRPALSPHAPYSVRSSLFFAASTCGYPVAVHLAETMSEQELLVCRTGPFVRFLQDLDAWAPDGLAEDVGHVLRLLNGLSPTLLIHCNFLPPNDSLPANTSVVYCPRTHAAFGHPPHPFREFQKHGVRVALGTDSLASNPDLDILSEMRFLHTRYPDVPGEVILRMGTLAGAEALGWSDETGSLTPGKSADLVVLPLPAEVSLDPYWLVLRSTLQVQKVLFRGQWIWSAATSPGSTA